MKRSVYFVSESTGITAKKVGESLLSQFDGLELDSHYVPFLDTPDKALALAQRLGEERLECGARPIVFATLVDKSLRQILKQCACLYIELFDAFIDPLSAELGIHPTGRPGVAHGQRDQGRYDARIDAINFAMANDDGIRLDKFDEADVILIGVSRSGKTPTCLYLAMNFGLRAANYPLTADDFDRDDIPFQLLPFRHKIVGLTIDPLRLHRVREERRPGSTYACLEQCQREVAAAMRIMGRLNVNVLDSTSRSIEELASHIVEVPVGGAG